jgi:hypothetical protein
MKFYDRTPELKAMGRLTKNFRIAVVGRRRIGKTTLVEHHYDKKCITLFIPAEKAEKEIVSDWVKEYGQLHLPQVTSFKDFFDFIFYHLKDRIFFIDEIQNVLKVNKSFLSDLQRLIDKYKPNLVVSGSLIGTMKRIVEDYKSPLYGRFDLIIKLRELDFRTIHEICRDFKMSTEQAIRFYSVFGGVPKYYELLEKMGFPDLEEFVLDMFVRYPRPLYEEVKTMLKEEFGSEHRTFFTILSAISQGNNRSSEIAGYLGKKETEITKYLAMLRDEFEIIDRVVPVVGGKKGIYVIKSNLVSFWFRNIWRHSQLFETGQEKQVEEIVLRDLDLFISRAFEGIVHELFIGGAFPFEHTSIGRQWGKIPGAPKDRNQYEIDLLALNERTHDALFVECKWQKDVNALTVLERLVTHSSSVQWRNGRRGEQYAIFAKSFKKKIARENLYLFDLKDITRILLGSGS